MYTNIHYTSVNENKRSEFLRIKKIGFDFYMGILKNSFWI